MRPKTHIPLLLTAGLILGLVSYALSGASEPALTSSATASSQGHHPPTPPGCEPKPRWALGILGDLYEFLRGPCDRCDDRNPCTNDSWRHGACVHQALEGPRCDDGNACTRADACVAGVCEGTARECSTSKPCHTASCNPKNGKCATKPASGSSCDDGNTCTDADVCAKGVCQGGPARDCSSDNPCQVGSCSLESGGCALTPVADGTACDGDGDVCNGAGSCRAGACVVTSSSTYVVSGTSEVPLFVEASSSGGVYVAANVSGSQNVVGQNVRADAAGDILVTELDAKGLPVFSTLIAGAGRQEVRAIATDKAGDLQVFLQTDQSIGFEFDVQRCGLDGDTLFCSAPPGTGCTFQTPDGPIPCGFCGNGRVDHPDEECDDENQRDGDGCSSSCKREIGGIDISPTPIDPIPDPDDTLDPRPPLDPGGVIDPLAPIGVIAPVNPLAPNGSQQFASAAISAAAAVGLPVCVVPGSPDAPGNTTVTINRTTGKVILVLVYPDLGSGGAWRPALQPQAETHYVYGYTPNATIFGNAPVGGVDLVAGIYSLIGQTNCIYLENLTAIAKDQWGSSGAELADRAIVSAGKFWLFSSFTDDFELGGADISCSTPDAVVGGTAVAAVTPGVAPAPAPLLVSTPAPIITCLPPPPPPPPPPPAARALPSFELAPETRSGLVTALLEAPAPNPLAGAVSLATSAGIWWGGGTDHPFSISTPEGEVEVPAEGEGIAAFVVLIDTETGSVQLRYSSGAPGEQVVRALGADRDENVVIAGDFDQRLDIGPDRFFSKGGRDVFVAKLSPSGDILFRGTYGGPGNDTAEAVSVSPVDDAIQLSLLTEGGIDFGNGPLAKGAHFVHLSSAPDVPSCASDNPCSAGSCDPLKGCVFTDLPDGSACQGNGKIGKCVEGTCSIGG